VAVARRVKKSLWQRLKDSFKEGGAGADVGSYIVHDVVIPAAKSTIADLVEGAIEMILFGDGARNPRIRRAGGKSYVSYADLYSKGAPAQGRRASMSRRSHNVEPASMVRNDFSGVVLGSRDEAEIVLSQMIDLVDEYDVVSVRELYELVGLPTDFTDNKIGWFDLDGVVTKRTRDGWAIELPRPRVID
jgi:hypothetical protein